MNARRRSCLTFDGPGQGQALFEQRLHFRPDWEAVVTPVVDYALTRDDVDRRLGDHDRSSRRLDEHTARAIRCPS